MSCFQFSVISILNILNAWILEYQNVKTKVKKDQRSKKTYNLMNELRSAYSELNSYQQYIYQHIESYKCANYKIKEDTEHYLIHWYMRW